MVFYMASEWSAEYIAAFRQEGSAAAALSRRRGLPPHILIGIYDHDRLAFYRAGSDGAVEASDLPEVGFGSVDEELPPLVYRLEKAFASQRASAGRLYLAGVPDSLAQTLADGFSRPCDFLSPGAAAAYSLASDAGERPGRVLQFGRDLRLFGPKLTDPAASDSPDDSAGGTDIAGIIINAEGAPPPSGSHPRGSAGALIRSAWDGYAAGQGEIGYRSLIAGYRRNDAAAVELIRQLVKVLGIMVINILQVDPRRDISLMSPINGIGPSLAEAIRESIRQQLLPRRGPELWNKAHLLLDYRRHLIRGAAVYAYCREGSRGGGGST
jgi:hypothetical protein